MNSPNKATMEALVKVADAWNASAPCEGLFIVAVCFKDMSLFCTQQGDRAIVGSALCQFMQKKPEVRDFILKAADLYRERQQKGEIK